MHGILFQGDQRFAELLNRCRTGQHTPEDIALLETRIVHPSDCPAEAPRYALSVYKTELKLSNFYLSELTQQIRCANNITI